MKMQDVFCGLNQLVSFNPMKIQTQATENFGGTNKKRTCYSSDYTGLK